jgi:hypothetical protein
MNKIDYIPQPTTTIAFAPTSTTRQKKKGWDKRGGSKISFLPMGDVLASHGERIVGPSHRTPQIESLYKTPADDTLQKASPE